MTAGSRTGENRLYLDEHDLRVKIEGELARERAARVRAEEALRQALRFCESYCEATDPDPREDDGEEMSVASAYVLSAMLSIAEGVAAVPEENQ